VQKLVDRKFSAETLLTNARFTLSSMFLQNFVKILNRTIDHWRMSTITENLTRKEHKRECNSMSKTESAAWKF